MNGMQQDYEGLELSTRIVIREALERGHSVELLDRKENFIRIRGNGRIEYIRQATRTALDTYIAPLIMENKAVTKHLLAEAGIRVPAGDRFDDPAAARASFEKWKDRDCVVKPNTTNFGTAVTVLERPYGSEAFFEALGGAFKEDGTVLVEERLPGKEYRFLVIGGAVRAVLHRVPANVTGDGKSSIRDLVDGKNEDPRRGSGYVLPLERIRLEETELAFLSQQGLSADSVPAEGAVVFLRENSNISTGGDSLDFTDIAHPGYGDIAAAAAAAVNAVVCGVDLMAIDIEHAPTDGNYGIIELNYNPALHIHDFPYSGENRHVEKFVLDLLGL